MSLDVYLMNDSGVELYSRNITHNLGRMAQEAGIYKCLWRPEEIDITHANQMIYLLENGVALLATEKDRFEKFNSPNGWGMWEHFVPFCMDYLQACRNYPEAQVEVSR
jgi:hypothetical protein